MSIWERARNSESGGALDGEFIQICFVVEDLDVAMERYSAFFGAGPWFLVKWWEPQDDPSIYRGARTPLETRTALAYAGDMMFELVCPGKASRSIFTEWVETRGYGIHHYGFGVDDFERTVAALDQHGLDIPFVSRTPRGTRVAMVDGGSELGALKEFIEMTPLTRKFYAFMRQQAARWDRRSLVFDGVLPRFE
jgi:catechol 2,3-dioxygenase-like lactoylglutathione lyase family enzyme